MKPHPIQLVGTACSPESVYAEKYQWLLRWALHFCDGDREMAEDLVQDTFMRMLSSWSSIRDVANPERFLYAYLRYGYLRLRRSDRRHNFQPLSSIDFELIDVGVDQSYAGLVKWQEELHMAVDFLCWRKTVTKSASMLLLRFFHGFFPSEIMQIAKLPRKAVDGGIASAKLEVKAYIAEPGMLKLKPHGAEPASPRVSGPATSIEEFMPQMLHVVFASGGGKCPPSTVLDDRYNDRHSTPIDCWLLSHIVSCPHCLDRIVSQLNLPPRGSRPLDDILGYAPKAEANGSKHLSSVPRRTVMRSLTGGKERYREVLEHRPSRIILTINGEQVASRDVSSSVNELTIDLKTNDMPELIEVLSEHTLLLTVPVVSMPPEAGPMHRVEMGLSEGRRVTLTLNFMPNGARVYVTYEDPLTFEKSAAVEPATRNRREDTRDETFEIERQSNFWNEMKNWFRNLASSRWRLATVCLLLGIVGMPLWLNRVRHSSAKILDRAVLAATSLPAAGIESQRLRITSPGFAVEETLHRDLSRKRFPKRANVPAQQLILENKLATANIKWSDPLSPGSFREWHDRQRNASDSIATDDGQLITVTTVVPNGPVREASLTLRADTFHTVGRTVTFKDNEQVEIAELDDTVMPWSKSDPGWFESSGGDASLRDNAERALRPAREPLPQPSTQGELDEAELGARLALMELNADGQERLSIVRGENRVVIAGLIATEARKREIERRLRLVPHVTSAIRTFAQLDATTPVSVPQSPTVLMSAPEVLSPLETISAERHMSAAETSELHDMLLDAAFSLRQSALGLRDLDSRFRLGTLTDEGKSHYVILSELYSARARAATAKEAEALTMLGEKRLPPTESETTAISEMVLSNAQLCFELISRQTTTPRPAIDILHDLSSSLAAIERAKESASPQTQASSLTPAY
jgi:DNA-directed RNA polymerase specialized sigma24 family protein